MIGYSHTVDDTTIHWGIKLSQLFSSREMYQQSFNISVVSLKKFLGFVGCTTEKIYDFYNIIYPLCLNKKMAVESMY